MSHSNINAFYKYIISNFIPNNNITFPINKSHININHIISKKIPNLSIYDLITQIFEIFIHPENVDMIVLYTINILNSLKTKGIYLNYLTSHRLILIIIMLSTKLGLDDCHSNLSWSKVFGLKLNDINQLEITIIKLFNFDLFVIITPEKSMAIRRCIY